MQIDDRVGSRELLRPLRVMGVPAVSRRLAFGDAAFAGHGRDGRVRVGVERKTVAEIVGSSFTANRRFTRRQLPGLLKTYDEVWVVVEGYTSVARDGVLMAGKWEAGFGPGRHTYVAYKKFLVGLSVKARVHVEPTRTFTETVHFLHALYSWWQTPWVLHKSLYDVDRTEPDRAILTERTWTRQVFAQYPGVGWTRSLYVAKHFGSVEAGSLADAREWCEVRYLDAYGKSHRLGPGRAATIKRYLQGKEKGHGKGA